MTNLCPQPYCQSLDLLILGAPLLCLVVVVGVMMIKEKRDER